MHAAITVSVENWSQLISTTIGKQKGVNIMYRCKKAGTVCIDVGNIRNTKLKRHTVVRRNPCLCSVRGVAS